MALPFEPELEELMKNRFSDAINPVYLIKAIEQGGARPGQFRKHVFDYYDGTRLIVSRDTLEGAGTFLHVSVSFYQVTPPVGPDLLRMVIDKVKELGGLYPGMVQAFSTNGGILHFLFPDIPSGKMKGAIVPPNPSWN